MTNINKKLKNDSKNIVVKCKYCNKDFNIIKKGIIKKSNKKVYYCKNCKKYFSIGKDNRIKRDNKERELALLLYIHNSSLRSIQNIIEKFYNTKISFRLIEKWIKSFKRMLNIDVGNRKDKNKKIDILEMDELWSYYYDLKKKEEKESKYGLLLIGEEIKLLHLK